MCACACNRCPYGDRSWHAPPRPPPSPHTHTHRYKQYIEKDAALARRFQEVYVGEPNVEDTITILRGLRERYEVHHGVQISDASLVAAANLSAKYMTVRVLKAACVCVSAQWVNERARVCGCFRRSATNACCALRMLCETLRQGRLMPDKAVDLVDEAASRLRLQQDSKPERIWKLEKHLATKKIEIEALRLEKDKGSAERLRVRGWFEWLGCPCCGYAVLEEVSMGSHAVCMWMWMRMCMRLCCDVLCCADLGG